MGTWTNSATDHVLELLGESGLYLPPGVIENNLSEQMARPPSYRTILRAIDGLEERGLIADDSEKDGHYRITDRGRRFLEGDIHPDDLDDA